MFKSKLRIQYEEEVKKNEELRKENEELETENENMKAQLDKLSETLECVGVIDGGAERIDRIVKECEDLKNRWRRSITRANKARENYENLYKGLMEIKTDMEKKKETETDDGDVKEENET